MPPQRIILIMLRLKIA